MKYLNERITQQIDLGAVQTKGMYKYEVQTTDRIEQSGWSTIFVGNYYNNAERWHTFDITDLCRSRKRNIHTTFGKSIDSDVFTVEQYRIIVTKSDDTTVTGSTITVAHVYPYPNVQKSTRAMQPYNAFFDITTANNSDVSLLLQGNNRYATGRNNLYLCPRYPLVGDEQDLDNYYTMVFGATIEFGSALQDVTFFSVEAGADYTNTDKWYGSYSLDHLGFEGYSHTFFRSYGYFLNTNEKGGVPLNTDYWVYMTWTNSSGVSQYRRIAIIEACKSRYYLLWQDRFGSYQSQPFKGKMEYSENITNSEYISYTGERHKYNVQVQPKWKINSGWITEDLYPFYESIYVSPILRLYDTETETEYDVILNDNYVEKKYVNSKSMLNLQLNLEATEKQNMTY